MKRHSIFFLFILCCSCADDDDVDCSSALPPPNWFEIGFFDTNGNALIGTTYNQETFRLYNSSEETFISKVPFSSPEYLQVRFDSINPQTEYFLELSATDQDTLVFDFSLSNGPCFSWFVLEGLTYNGDEIPLSDNSRIDLIKE
ncbi:MAG: hypothetical protein HKO67_14665 [Flavobacteriaceae bacterium]|nr:hypothetical protein [Flavobacteriaceae bacterium]